MHGSILSSFYVRQPVKEIYMWGYHKTSQEFKIFHEKMKSHHLLCSSILGIFWSMWSRISRGSRTLSSWYLAMAAWTPVTNKRLTSSDITILLHSNTTSLIRYHRYLKHHRHLKHNSLSLCYQPNICDLMIKTSYHVACKQGYFYNIKFFLLNMDIIHLIWDI